MSVTAKAQHTPGPWMHKATAGNHDFAIYPESTGRDVALVRDFNEANARLIAAAPELLAALKQTVAWLEALRPLATDALLNAQPSGFGLNSARAAITQAESAP